MMRKFTNLGKTAAYTLANRLRDFRNRKPAPAEGKLQEVVDAVREQGY